MDELTSVLNPEPVATPALPDTETGQQEREIDILDLLIIFARHKWRIGKLALAAGVLGYLCSFLLPTLYTGRTTLIPPQQQQSSLMAAFLGQLGPISALAGKDAIKNPTDLMVTILESRTVSDAIIDRFDLGKVYGKKLRTDLRDKLHDRTTVTAGKDGVITLLVEDTDPKRAADIANQYVSELYAMTQTLSVTEASQRRRFFEEELGHAKEALGVAEADLRKTQEGTGLIKLDDQAKAVIEAVGRLRAEIAAKEVALRAMRSFATEQNPDLLRTTQELEGLRAQLAKLENSSVAGNGNVLVPTSKVPEAGLEYVRKLRELKYREAVYELLLKQYESARIDEAKSPALIQVIDRAVVPEKKSSPKRLLIAIVTAVLGFMTAVTLSLYSEWSMRNPEQKQRLLYFAQTLRAK